MSGVKIYWRKPFEGATYYHAFKKQSGGGYLSLCKHIGIERSGGQSSGRPGVWERCALCDSREITLRGWKESGPAAIERSKG